MVHEVRVTPLQKLSPGQAAHTRLVVRVHAAVSYWFEAQAAVHVWHTAFDATAQALAAKLPGLQTVQLAHCRSTDEVH
jgi:hypothetical protein